MIGGVEPSFFLSFLSWRKLKPLWSKPIINLKRKRNDSNHDHVRHFRGLRRWCDLHHRGNQQTLQDREPNSKAHYLVGSQYRPGLPGLRPAAGLLRRLRHARPMARLGEDRPHRTGLRPLRQQDVRPRGNLATAGVDLQYLQTKVTACKGRAISPPFFCHFDCFREQYFCSNQKLYL